MATAIAERQGQSPRRMPLVPVLAGAMFAVLAYAVQSHGPLVGLDLRILDWLNVHRTPGGTRVAQHLVALGQPSLAPLVLLALASVLGVRRRSWEPIRFAVITVSVLTVAVLVAKNVFGRPGPGGVVGSGMHGRLGEVIDLLDRGAFPSGHTTTAIVIWSVGVTLVRGHLGRAGMALVAAVALLVGGAMVYGGFHWFSDVLGAFPFGIALTWALLRIPHPMTHRANRTDSHVSDFLGRRPVTTRSRAGA